MTGGASEPDFVLETEIGAPPDEVHAALCDLHRLSPLHPLIESIDEIDPDPALPGATRYRVVDRIPIGPLRMKTTYVAALEAVSDTEVHGHAWQSPGVRLRTIYALEACDRGARLVERCHVHAPRWLRRFVVSQARAAHAEMLRGLGAMLEHERANAPPPSR